MRNLYKSQNFLFIFNKNFYAFSGYVAPLSLIKQLREETSSPITECKKALEAHNGDMGKAKEYLKERGLSQAQKKLTRTVKEGVIGVYHNTTTKTTAVAEVNCETDFVARTELFTSFVDSLVKLASSHSETLKLTDTKDQENLDKLIEEFSMKNILKETVIPDHSNISISETKQLVISKLQENIKIRRIMTIKETSNTINGIYVHNTLRENVGTSACVLTLECNTTQAEKLQEVAYNMAMQILGTKPQYLELKDIPKEVLEEEGLKIKTELGQALAGKPENVVQKIIDGKLKRFYQDSVLYLMDYILAPEGEELSVRKNAVG